MSWRFTLDILKMERTHFKKLVPHLHKEADEGYLCFSCSADHTHHFGDNHFFIGFQLPTVP